MEIEHLCKSLVVLWGQQSLHCPLRQLLESLIRRREQGEAGTRVFGEIGSEFGLFQKRLQAAEVFLSRTIRPMVWASAGSAALRLWGVTSDRSNAAPPRITCLSFFMVDRSESLGGLFDVFSEAR